VIEGKAQSMNGSRIVNRPGQIKPNEFELAILERIAVQLPKLRTYLGNLHVLSREFTGVGSYTNFKCKDVRAQVTGQRIGLNDLIVMPNIQNGMGAVLLCHGDQPKCLETYTFGDELWDGVFEGFVIQKAPAQP
jgi:hypothetical protein